MAKSHLLEEMNFEKLPMTDHDDEFKASKDVTRRTSKIFPVKSLSFICLFYCLCTIANAQTPQFFSELEILTRKQWKAKAPTGQMIPHQPVRLTIHHTGMPQLPGKSLGQKMRDLQKFSQSNAPLASGQPRQGWHDVPYHFYIDVHGNIAQGRETGFQGASNTDYDLQGHLLVVLEGDFNKEPVTHHQYNAFLKLLNRLSNDYDIPLNQTYGHGDYASTSCPGTGLKRILPSIRKQEPVVLGIEQLLGDEKKIKELKSQRIGLITNHTGVKPDGIHLIDALIESGLKLTTLFSPEHGIRGEEDTHVSNQTDTRTGLPIYSLYGETRKPTPKMLQDVDVLLFDIQDIGARYYTYIRTMQLALEAAAENNKVFIVLDRPNPIGPAPIEGKPGPLKDSTLTQVEGLPITHKMTIGEIATMINGERSKSGHPVADLQVITMAGYQRNLWFDETLLPWKKPSPNMLHFSTSLLYPATCLLEGTNVSEGRGTLFPFEYVAAPWLDVKRLKSALEQKEIPGLSFAVTEITPQKTVDGITIYPPKFVNETIPALRIQITNRDEVQPVAFGIHLLYLLKKIHPESFKWKSNRIDGLLKTDTIRKDLNNGVQPETIQKSWQTSLETFKNLRKNYLLYP